MDYRHNWPRRIGAALLAVTTGVATAQAAGPGGRAAACEPRGPLFQVLDSLAGGIETVLQRTVLSSCGNSACDAIACDDGCDAITVSQLRPLPSRSHGHRGVSPRHREVQRSHQSAPRVHRSVSPPRMHGSHGAHRAHHSGAMQAEQPGGPHELRPVPHDASPLEPPVLHAEQELHTGGLHEVEVEPAPRERAPARPLPQVPQEREPLTTEDGWIDSFEPSAPRTPIRTRSSARRPERRSSGLTNPFLDDAFEGR